MKFGALRAPDGSWIGYDARPAAVKNFLAHTLTRLGTDHIDVYRPARLDPNVPIEETMGAIADLVKAGWVRAAGLSEVGTETVRRAHTVTPVADLQIEYSLVSRGPEAAIFPALDALGIGVTAYGVLSRGLLSGSQPAATGDIRTRFPRFADGNRERNDRLVAAIAAVAAEKGTSATRIAIAWALAKGPSIVPVIGARTPRAARRGAFRPRRRALAGGRPPPRSRRAGVGGRGHALRRARDEDARQRARLTPSRLPSA